MHKQTVIPTGIEPLISKGCSLLVNRCAVMQMQTDVNAEKQNSSFMAIEQRTFQTHLVL